MSIIISVEALEKKLTSSDLVMLDVRTKYESFQTGKAAYEDSHITGAIYLDFKDDLSGKDTFLPDVEKLAEKLGALGISSQTEIVIYDEGYHRAASKAWFVLNYMGHDRLQLLNGGFSAWVEAGGTVTSDIPDREPKNYTVNKRPELLLQIEDIKKRIGDEQSVLIDSRSYKRYTGEVEPKYQKAGHIPGAVN